MKPLKATFFGLTASALLLGSASVGSAAAIIWDPATTISADTDVSTTGTFLKAFNLGDSSTSVVINGVTFAVGPTPNGTYTLTAGSGAGSLTITSTSTSNDVKQTTAFGSTKSPFSSLSTDYKTLLKSANYVYPGPPTATATINSLTIGQQYEVQFWINDSRGASGRTATFTATNAATIDYNLTDADGGVGQFVIGTFTADAITQTISIESNTNGAFQLNAYQIRAIPEPSTMASLLAGLGMLLGVRRRSARTGLRPL